MSFDLKTHIRNKDGAIVRKQPYKLQIKEGVRRYERPVGSGVWYFENGEPCVKQVEKVESTEKIEAKVEELLPKEETKSDKEVLKKAVEPVMKK